MIYFVIYLVISLLSLSFFWKKISRENQKALLWYYIFYFFSNMFGAIIFGIADKLSFGVLIDFVIDTYIQGEFVKSHLENLYWFLLFSPIIILPIFSLDFKCRLRLNNPIKFNLSSNAFAIATLIIISIFIGEIIISDNIGILTLNNLTNSKENYADYIIGRADVFNSMSNRFFGLLYMTLPFFSHISIYNSFKRKGERIWPLLSLILVVLITIVSIGVNQKAPLIIYFISLIIGINFVKKFNTVLIIVVPLIVLVLVNTLQVFIQGTEGWNFALSFFHTIFRAPASIPFYVNYYPEQLPFVGVDFGILANLYIPATEATDNVEIHTIMWGQSFESEGVTGTVASPFQYRAFAQAGLLFSILNIIIVSFFIKFLGWVIKSNGLSDKSISHGFFTQSLIVLYFVSQTHIKDCIWSSYGVIWLIKGFILLLVIEFILMVTREKKKSFFNI